MISPILVQRLNNSQWAASEAAVKRLVHHFSPELVSHRAPKITDWRRLHDYLVIRSGDAYVITSRSTGRLKSWCDESHIILQDSGLAIDPHQMSPDTDALKKIVPTESKLPEILTSAYTAQIMVRTVQDIARLAIEITAGFPEAAFLFPQASNSAARTWQRRLEAWTDEPVSFFSGPGQPLTTRLSTCPYPAALRCNFERAPICVFLGAPSVHWRFSQLVSQTGVQRVYVVRPAGQYLGSIAEEELLHRIGPCVDEAMRGRCRHEIHILRFGGNLAMSFSRVPVKVDKNKLFIAHEARNETLARLAVRLSNNHFPDASKRTAVWVLVEHLQHAKRLAALMPGWPVVSRDDNHRLLEGNSIVTLSALAGCREAPAAKIVNGTGGAPSSTLLHRLTTWAKARWPVKLYDLSDGFCRDAASLGKGRMDAYRRAGAIFRGIDRSTVKHALSGR